MTMTNSMMMSLSSRVFLLLALSSSFLSVVQAQGTEITVTVDGGDGLVYLLLVLMFGIVFLTPILRFIYLRYIDHVVQGAKREIARASRLLSNRLSDVGRKTMQSIRKP